jgi:hypothetical protein
MFANGNVYYWPEKLYRLNLDQKKLPNGQYTTGMKSSSISNMPNKCFHMATYTTGLKSSFVSIVKTTSNCLQLAEYAIGMMSTYVSLVKFMFKMTDKCLQLAIYASIKTVKRTCKCMHLEKYAAGIFRWLHIGIIDLSPSKELSVSLNLGFSKCISIRIINPGALQALPGAYNCIIDSGRLQALSGPKPAK